MDKLFIVEEAVPTEGACIYAGALSLLRSCLLETGTSLQLKGANS